MCISVGESLSPEGDVERSGILRGGSSEENTELQSVADIEARVPRGTDDSMKGQVVGYAR